MNVRKYVTSNDQFEAGYVSHALCAAINTILKVLTPFSQRPNSTVLIPVILYTTRSENSVSQWHQFHAEIDSTLNSHGLISCQLQCWYYIAKACEANLKMAHGAHTIYFACIICNNWFCGAKSCENSYLHICSPALQAWFLKQLISVRISQSCDAVTVRKGAKILDAQDFAVNRIM